MANWRDGMRTLCIAEFTGANCAAGRRLGVALPREGAIYTVRAVEAFGEEIALRLVEIVNPPLWGRCPDGERRFLEPAFGEEAFRPLVEDRSQFALLERLAEGARDCVAIEGSP